jgi:plastocyanin
MIRRARLAGLSLALFAAACGGQPTSSGGGGGTQAGPETIQVQAEDYKYGGVPQSLPPGQVTFAFENVGEEPHEFSLVRVKGDRTVEELVSLPQQQAQRFIEQVGGTFAKPGEEGKPLQADLGPGRYGYACFVSTKDGTPHAALGMYGEFTVA